MSEPVYEEDLVNLGYLNKKINGISKEIKLPENVSRHYASKPQPPYYAGDTWIDGKIVYTCIKSREIGLYADSDWVTESGAKEEAEQKNKTYLTKPSNYSPGDMWILQSDNDHKAGKKGEILISTAGRSTYDENDWVNMLSYGTIISINEVANNLNEAINKIGKIEEATEDGLIVIFYQDSEPEEKHIGDLWYVTGEVEGYEKGKIYRYDGTDWLILNDPTIQEAFDEANESKLIADGKIQSFYSNIEPTENMSVGDLWIDLDNNNQLYRYNGTNWVVVYDTNMDELVTLVDTTIKRVATIETDLGEIDLKVQETTTKITTIEGQVEDIEQQQTETNEKLAEQQITVDGIQSTVSQTQTMVGNNYNELKTKFDDYAPKSDVVSLQTSVEKIQTDTYTKTEINTKLTDGSVTKVLTTAGTFDDNGLTIEKTDAKTKGNFNEKGIAVLDATSGGSQELLFAGYDEELNETIVRSKNMTVEKYFVESNIARREEYSNPILRGKGIGVFIL